MAKRLLGTDSLSGVKLKQLLKQVDRKWVYLAKELRKGYRCAPRESPERCLDFGLEGSQFRYQRLAGVQPDVPSRGSSFESLSRQAYREC